MIDNNRIKHALLHDGWEYNPSDKPRLHNEARLVLASEYTSEMVDRIFCPECCTNLSRSPKDKAKFSNGRSCCFVHRPTFRDVECSLRTPAADGKRYLTEEDAKHAIENDQLAIINSFMQDRPEKLSATLDPYDQSVVEDITGPISSVPIARHRGERFELPSRITTVAGLCRRFDKNLYKFFVLPNSNVAQKLTNVLVDIATVTEECEIPRLYYGKVVRSYNAGQSPKPTNIRMTELRSHPSVKDFYLKIQAAKQEEKGINSESAGRIVLFWGKIVESGIGLAASGLSWGEFALLPEKYEKLLLSD
ncbi:hypothetical protein LDP08_14220 [Ralstonia pseudosolanacearum]|uniref:hypothetical protein n=1 Tax=Ralstonia pseudosolanacearum TaxID=1310165 RepID=UPI003CFA9540